MLDVFPYQVFPVQVEVPSPVRAVAKRESGSTPELPPQLYAVSGLSNSCHWR